jgi:hypothetical protein
LKQIKQHKNLAEYNASSIPKNVQPLICFLSYRKILLLFYRSQNTLDEAIEPMIHKGRYFETLGAVYKGVYSFSIEQLEIATSFYKSLQLPPEIKMDNFETAKLREVERLEFLLAKQRYKSFDFENFGMSSLHRILKCGATCLDTLGRLSHSWKISKGFPLSSSMSGKISEC